MPRTRVDVNFTNIRAHYFHCRKGTNLTYKQYTAFMHDLNATLVQYVLDGNILHLPFGLGSVYVQRRMPKQRTTMINGKPVPRKHLIDYKKTMELRRSIHPDWTHEQWKTIPYEERPFVMYNNDLTNGYSYRIKWEKRGTTVKGMRYYQFVPVRTTFKRELGKILKSNNINKPHYYD